MRIMEDSQIIDLYWERDERAISETDQKYGGYCRTVANNILTDREEAEKCVNDVYYRVWNSIPPERPRILRAWLGKITRNAAINQWNLNHAKKRYGGMELLLSELDECVPSASSVELETETSEIGKCISTWLRSLPPDARILFVRRYFNGESVRALAQELRTSPEKITQKLYRLRRSLKQVLEKEGINL